MTLRAKVMVLGVAWIMLLAAAIFAVESLLMRAFLVGLAMIKTIVILRLRTARSP